MDINWQLTIAYSTSIYLQWNPVKLDKSLYSFREYYVDIVAGELDASMEHNYTTSNTSVNITGLQPSTDYHIAVSYSVTENDQIKRQSNPHVLNITTRALCKLDRDLVICVSCTQTHTHKHTHNTHAQSAHSI